MIKQVVLWQNGMVMTMDEAGSQLPEYQGPIADVGEAILRDAPRTAGFQRGIWGHGAAHQLVQIRWSDFADLLNDARKVEPNPL